MKKASFIVLSIFSLILSFSCVDYSKSPYDFSKLERLLELDGELDEISGIQKLNNGRLAAVQDEKGKIYQLDEATGEIVDEYKFGKKGDYEGICYAKEDFFVLESDGTIHKVRKGKKKKEYKFKGGDKYDFEGICFDEENDRLLVACKDHDKKKKRDNLYVYTFSLSDLKYEDKAVFKLSKKPIHKNFGASGISIHPNGDIYIISSRSRTLLILNSEGEIKQVIPLGDIMFKQPEGITFNSEGDIYISNEGGKSTPTILKYTQRRK